VPSVRLATWNLLHGLSIRDGSADPDRLAAAAAGLGEVDVVALQEVDRGQLRSGEVDQTAVVAEAVGAVAWHFEPALFGEPGAGPVRFHAGGRDPGGPAYGIGLVSRWPVSSWRVRRFPAAPVSLPLLVPGSGLAKIDDEPRIAISATVELPSGPVRVVATHLSFVPGWNLAQLRTLLGDLDREPHPVLLLGDLNLPHAVVRRFRRWTPAGPAATYPSWRPRIQFDHVLLRRRDRWDLGSARAVPGELSDHRPLLVDLQVESKPH
jgi:endonuclease/exonuclease/phosphatase family metal-dependent hydrolase